jgi:hypothetical protein
MPASVSFNTTRPEILFTFASSSPCWEWADRIRNTATSGNDGRVGPVSLQGIYRWAESRGYKAQHEHVLIEGLPTQFIPAPDPLAREAIAAAAEIDYQGVVVRVVRPEYLVALYLQPQAKTPKRRERAAMLLELPSLNRNEVGAILERHGLSF